VMNTITINISDAVLSELRNEIGCKGITGNLYGVQDAFTMKIITAIEKGEKEVTLQLKSERTIPKEEEQL